MTFVMNLRDEKLSLAEILKGLALIIPVIIFLVSIDSKTSITIEKQAEMRKTQVEFVKDYYIDREAMKNDINLLKLDLQLLKQRVDAMEKNR